MNIRTRGLLGFVGFGALFGLIVFWYANPEFYPFSYHPVGPAAAIFIGAPGAFSAVGLIEFASGQPFYKLEETWQGLKWWQRGIWGTLFVVFGGAIAFSVVILALL
ncbi:MAG: hypothetical protein ABJ308_09160 [Halieaceae bacterium]